MGKQEHGVGDMELRQKINEALKAAMRERDKARLSTLRLVNAALKDRDIELRSRGEEAALSDADILAILGKMVKQRQESARAYEEGGRLEMAEQERAEIRVIEEFLPRKLGEEETRAAIEAAIAATGAGSIRDMGKVMGVLKGKYAGQMDFGQVGPMVKERLG